MTQRSPDLNGRAFWKMSGSGNDFVFFDNRDGAHDDLASPGPIAALCDRQRGVGADGIVLIDRHPSLAFGMRYYNRDGSLAEMCGNAALCSALFARTRGMVDGTEPFAFETPSGPVTARFRGAEPSIDMVPVTELAEAFDTPRQSGETRIGYARVGVPHLVVLVEDVEQVDVITRGRTLRYLEQLPRGANVNFVSRDAAGRWALRTYERGVEDETLACGTGSVAVSALLNVWGYADGPVTLRARACDLHASAGQGGPPQLRGEARLVFAGTTIQL